MNRRNRARGQRHTLYLAVSAAMALMLFICPSHGVRSQGGPNPASMQGETNRVLLLPNRTVPAGEIKFQQDSDDDGMTDADEETNGTDPNNPADADADNDGDTLTNGDEVARGTGVNDADTDDDGTDDGAEVNLGFNPTDPNSQPPTGATVTGISISPASVALSINTMLGQDPVQLKVTGVLSDGTTTDLTRAPGTTYQSLDESVVAVDDAGQIAGVANGAAFVTAQNSTFTAQVAVTVSTFAPTALSSIELPGYANNVDVAGDYAFVAAGEAGLQIVNVNNHQTPFILAAFDTPGNANDVAVVAGKAYVADGESGLRIIDVSDPAAPVALGSVDTPGLAEDVVVVGARAYVADGTSGLQVIDVSDASAPALLGTLDTAGYARGVGAAGQLVAVADGVTDTSDGGGDIEVTALTAAPAGNYLRIVNVSNPASPQEVGSVNLGFGEAMDVAVRERMAYVASLYGGVMAVDFTTPSIPRIVDNAFVGVPRDVALYGRYVMEAEVQFVNAVPIFDVQDPRVLSYRGAIDFSAEGDHNGTGIALDGQYLYLTGSFDTNVQTGTRGSTRLFIGQYQVHTQPADTAGVAPTVTIDSPQDGQALKEGRALTISATALDDVGVASVSFSVNGTTYATDVASPYSFTTYVPLGASTLTIGATAVDHAGNTGTAAPVVLHVSPDKAPTISITNPTEGTQLVGGQAVEITAAAADDTQIAQVVFNVNDQTLLPTSSDPYSLSYIVPNGIDSLSVDATVTDNLNKSATATRTLTVVPDTVAPSITLTNPAAGAEVFEGQYLFISADAADNARVASVSFFIDGQFYTELASPPYEITYPVPLGVSEFTIDATATDGAGRTASATRTVPVTPDPPPTVNIAAPAGTQLTEGELVQFIVEANDNAYVSYVEFKVDGTSLFYDFEAPYRQTYTVPVGVTTLSLEATATDSLGRAATASRTFNVEPDSGTTVNGRVIDTSAQPVTDATVTLFGEFTTQTGADGTFSLTNIPTVRGALLARVTATLDGRTAANASVPTAPSAGGITDLGDITLSTLPTAPTFACTADYTGDFVPDLIVGYPDRQSLIYQFDFSQEGRFIPSASRVLPYGAVISGATLATNFGQLQKVFTQGAGQPGSATDLVFRFGQMQLPVTLASGLAGESAYTAAGQDTGTGPEVETASQPREVYAFLSETGDALTVRYRSGAASSPGGFALRGVKGAATPSSIHTLSDNDEFDDESEFTAPAAVPLNASAPLRSLKLADVNGDGLLDILAIKPVAGTGARLVVIPRVSGAGFGAPIESPITVRSTNPSNAVNDFSVGADSGGVITHVYVLGDDRVRVYETDGSGAFTPDGEIMLPSGQLPTGIAEGDLNDDSLTDVLLTTKDANAPDAKTLLAYIRTQGDGFEPPTTRAYTAAPSNGDTRLLPGRWDGSFGSVDVVLIDGETVLYLRDVGPSNVIE